MAVAEIRRTANLVAALLVIMGSAAAAQPLPSWKHPEWKCNAAFKALMAGDHKALAEMAHKPVLELLAEAHLPVRARHGSRQMTANGERHGRERIAETPVHAPRHLK